MGRRPPYYGRHSLGRVWFALDRGSGPHCRVLQGALHCAAPARAAGAVVQQCLARTGLLLELAAVVDAAAVVVAEDDVQALVTELQV